MRGTTWMTVAALAVLGFSAMGGCRHSTVPAGRADPVSQENYPRVAAMGGLDKWLYFGPANLQEGPEQPLSVMVPVRSRAGHDISVQYRFEFMDATGRPQRQEMEWRYLLLPSRTQAFMEGAAMDTDVRDWRLVVRPAR